MGMCDDVEFLQDELVRTRRELDFAREELKVMRPQQTSMGLYPGGNPGANLESISYRCHPILVALVRELTELPPGWQKASI